MATLIQAQAQATLDQVAAVTATLLPEPGTALMTLAEATPAQAEAINTRMAEIDMTNTQSIISFGARAQAE